MINLNRIENYKLKAQSCGTKLRVEQDGAIFTTTLGTDYDIKYGIMAKANGFEITSDFVSKLIKMNESSKVVSCRSCSI